MSKLTTASVLAFERNLDISDAFFSQMDSTTDSKPIAISIKEKSVRGTISNRLKNAIANDPAKLDAEIEKANIVILYWSIGVVKYCRLLAYLMSVTIRITKQNSCKLSVNI